MFKTVAVAVAVVVAVVVASGACKSREAAPAPGPLETEPIPATRDPSGMVADPVGRRGEPESGPSGPHGAGPHGHDQSVVCPVEHPANTDAALDEAASRYDMGEFAVALACTELAVDLIPQAVEAHHLHAAALAAVQRYAEAKTAFAMAVALDPDDPETLAAAGDFYVNVIAPKQRDTTLLGLEYARRGSDKASTRRRRDGELRARLALLEAQALNDLGRPDEALPRVDDTIELMPTSIAARYERGVSLFNLCRFDAAYTELTGVLRSAPDDPYAHFHLALIYERKGRDADAAAHFDRARKLAPNDFPKPVMLTEEEFRSELDAAMGELSEDVRELLNRVTIEVTDVPAIADLTAVDPPFAPTILGLYRGFPLGIEPIQRGARSQPPRAIVLYRKSLGRAVRSRAELNEQIRRTLLHEIGHLHGLDEGQLRRRGLE